MQDEYKVASNWGLYDKWKLVEGQLTNANAEGGNGGIGSTMYINFLSGSTLLLEVPDVGNVLPLFVFP